MYRGIKMYTHYYLVRGGSWRRRGGMNHLHVFVSEILHLELLLT